MNIFKVLIHNIKERQWIEKTIDDMVYKYLINHYKLWSSEYDTEGQLGYLYIGPNEAYPKDYYNYKEFCESKWGWSWRFTNDYKAIKITFNTVKNQWLDIREDTEDVVPFYELLKYKEEL